MEETLFYVMAVAFLVSYATETAKILAKLNFSDKTKKNHPTSPNVNRVEILIIIIK